MPRRKQDDSEKAPTAKRKRRGRGEGTVYYRKSDDRWATDITLQDGKRKTFYGKTQEEVITKKKQAEYELKQGILATGPKQKLADHLTFWLEQVKKRKLRASSYIRYRGALNTHIIPALGQLSLNKVTLRIIQQFYNQKLDEGQSPSSVMTIHKVLNQGLAYAVKERLIAVNPCAGASLPAKEKRAGQPLTVAQAQHLLETVQGTMMDAFIALALVVGVRHGELLALRWQDIDLSQGMLAIHHTLTQDEHYRYVVGDPKTESSERTILLPQPVTTILLAHHTRQREAQSKAGPAWQDHDLVFCSKKGTQLWPSNVRQQFYRLLKRAGLPLMRIHDLRHSAATLLRKMGVDLKVIQEILGHSTLDTTANIYSHVLPDMQWEAAERMKTLFDKPS